MGRVAKAHSRLIWACSWAPDGRAFATGARDASVKVWALPPECAGAPPRCTAACFVSKGEQGTA